MTEDLDTTQDLEYSWTITNDAKESKTINLNAEILKILENSTRNPIFWNLLSCWSVVFLVRVLEYFGWPYAAQIMGNLLPKTQPNRVSQLLQRF